MQSTSYFPSENTHYAPFNQLSLPDSSSFCATLSPTNDVMNDLHRQHHNFAHRASLASTRVPGHDVTKQQNCQFLTRSVDNCSKSRFYASALEYYLLEDPSPVTPNGVACMMSKCPRAFRDAKQMLWHLRECSFFKDGNFDCPECNTTERFPTTSSRKCSWLRSRLSSKTMQFLHASAEVMKRMIGPKSSLCPSCQHTLTEDLGKTRRGCHDGSPTKGFEDSLLSCSDIGKRPSTGSSSSSSGGSGPGLSELYDTTDTIVTIPELPCLQYADEQYASELVGDAPQPQWGPNPAGPYRGERLPQALNVSQSTPRTENPFFSPEVSPTSSGRSPNTLDGTISTQYTSHNILSQMNTHHTIANTEQPSVNLPNHVYSHSSELTTSTIDIQGLAAGDIFLQESFESRNRPNRNGNENNHLRQPTPTLSVDIPTGVVPCDGAAMTWGPDFADITFGGSFGLTNDTAAAPPTPTVDAFNKAMSLARSNTVPFPRAAVAASASTTAYNLNYFRGQQKKSSFSSIDDLSSDSAISSSGSAGETDSVSPGSGSSGKSLPPLELQCSECDFVPTGKAEKRLAYFQKHQATHSGNRWSCQKCGKTYSRKDNATTHIKKFHGEGSLVFDTIFSSPATTVGNPSRKRQRSAHSESMSLQQQRKKSRSHSNESAAASAVEALLNRRGEWRKTE
ncbi:uncharacterized protein PG998_005703 [Apiospora kogelbergensis]|uniref:C2H2-type domain-containing protein n=1 Tax=Apiospora kogelbergensis TaxID=1337665 RepID=A0AAW0R395_9PEZI